jgi:hypothetical protein
MKIFKYIAMGFGVLVIAYLLYFATQLSGTYVPIKSYNFTMSSRELHQELTKVIEANSSWTFQITDTTGTDNTGRTFHAEVKFKDGSNELSYSVKYNDEDTGTSSLSVVGAFDHIKKSGGYKNGDDDVERLIRVFETQFVDKLIRD